MWYDVRKGGIPMSKNDINKILKQIAKDHNTTVSNVRKEMKEAMRMAQSSSAPAIQARWHAIPHNGPELTVEEFIMYLIATAKN